MKKPASADSISSLAVSSAVGDPLHAELLALCACLEAWRIAQANRPPDPGDLPRTNWRDARRGLIFLGLGMLTGLIDGWVKPTNSVPAMLILLLTLIACLVAGTFFLLRAEGLLTREFWRRAIAAVHNEIRPQKIFSFSTLRKKIDADFAAVKTLAGFSDQALALACRRLEEESAHLRDTATTVFGNASAVFVLGVPAGFWSAWQSVHGQSSTLTVMILCGFIIGIFFSAYSIHARLSVIDLTRSRALVELALAKRKFAKAVP